MRPLFVAGILLLLTSCLQAGPPAVTGLYPAGTQRGSTVEMTAIGTFDSWPVSLWTSSPQLIARAGKDKGKVTIKVAADAAPGTYWIRCHDAQGASGLRPFIVGVLPEVLETEPNDAIAKVQKVALPVTVNGKLNRNGDVDCYSMHLKQGQTLVASIESHQTLRSAGDMVMQLTDDTGTILAQNHDYHGLDPQLVFTVPRDGQFVVRLFGFPANPDSSIRFAGGDLYVYRLTLTTGSFAEHVLPLGIPERERDGVQLVGWNIQGKLAGTIVAREARGEVFHPQAAGVRPVCLERWPTVDATVAGSRPALPAPVCITGRLTREQPVFRTSVQFEKGKKLLVQIISPSLGLDVDPVLTIEDGSGKEVHKAETNGLHVDLLSSFTPAQSGKYTVKVGDLHRRHGARMVFLLRLVPEEPDYSLTVDADRFTLTAGKPLDVPVKVNSLAGFKDEVQLSVNGLPASLQWKWLSTTGPADKKVITLRLESKETLSTGFQIAGTVKGQPLLRRIAQASLSELGTTSAELWLTSVKK